MPQWRGRLWTTQVFDQASLSLHCPQPVWSPGADHPAWDLPSPCLSSRSPLPRQAKSVRLPQAHPGGGSGGLLRPSGAGLPSAWHCERQARDLRHWRALRKTRLLDPNQSVFWLGGVLMCSRCVCSWHVYWGGLSFSQGRVSGVVLWTQPSRAGDWGTFWRLAAILRWGQRRAAEGGKSVPLSWTRMTKKLHSGHAPTPLLAGLGCFSRFEE